MKTQAELVAEAEELRIRLWNLSLYGAAPEYRQRAYNAYLRAAERYEQRLIKLARALGMVIPHFWAWDVVVLTAEEFLEKAAQEG